MSQPWEFNQDLDTVKSFRGFVFYRDLGPMRSLEDAFNLYKPGEGRKPVSGFFNEWSAKGKWVERSRAYDAECDRVNREDATADARKHQNDRIEQIRQMTESIAIARLSTSLRTAIIVRDTVEYMQNLATKNGKAIFDGEQTKLLLDLIGIQNKDASTIEASLKLADDSLGISALIEQLAA